jgi:hypothetical protein
MVHPSVANLLSNSTWQLLRKIAPSRKGVFNGVAYGFKHDSILGFGPLAFA